MHLFVQVELRENIWKIFFLLVKCITSQLVHVPDLEALRPTLDQVDSLGALLMLFCFLYFCDTRALEALITEQHVTYWQPPSNYHMRSDIYENFGQGNTTGEFRPTFHEYNRHVLRLKPWWMLRRTDWLLLRTVWSSIMPSTKSERCMKINDSFTWTARPRTRRRKRT